MKLVYKPLVSMLCMVLIFSNLSLAQNNRFIPFQGTLFENGTAVNGTVNITFSISDPSWSEVHENVNVTQGVYAVVLGQTTPFPEDLFIGNSPELVVSIGGTQVANVALHQPYLSQALVDKNLPAEITRTFDEDGSEHNAISVTADGAGAGQTSAIEGIAKSSTYNTGIEGFAISETGNPDNQNGMYAQATGTGEGNHRGIYGVAGGGGKYNHGLKGYAQGSGNGDEGYGFGEGSINFGVEGNATGNAWSNTGVEGSNFGTIGKVNYGVHGISNAGTTESENYGVAGRAYGPGRNIGLYGTAGGGTESYAGFFDGDIMVNAGQYKLKNGNGDDILTIQEYGSGGGTLFAFNETGANTTWIGNDAVGNGFMQLVNYNEAGDTSEGAILAGFWGDGIPKIYIETSNNSEKARLSTFNDTGHFYLRGLSGTRTAQMGSKWWEGNSDQGYVVVYGTDEADKAMMHAVTHDTDQQEGKLTLSSTDGSSLNVSAHNLQAFGGDDTGVSVQAGGISFGQSSYTNGIVMNYDGTNGGVYEMYAGSTMQVFLNGSNGDASFQGNVYATSFESPNPLNVTSDRRFKRRVKPLDGALSKTLKLNGYTYYWNKLAEEQKGIANKNEQLGVLAQELEEVFPQLVKTDSKGFKSVNYASLTVVLLEAIKELSAKVEDLEDENQGMRAELTKVDRLEMKIDLLEKILTKQTLETGQVTTSR